MPIADITVYSDHKTYLLKSFSVLAFLLHVWVWVARQHLCFYQWTNLSLCYPGLILPLVFDLIYFHLLPKKRTSLLSSPTLKEMAMAVLSKPRHWQCFPDFDFCTSALKWAHHTKWVVAIWAVISLLAAPQCDGDKWLTDARWCTLAELYLHTLVAVVWHHACLTTFLIQ